MTEKNIDFPSATQALLLVLALFVAEVVVGAAAYDARGMLGLTRSQCDVLARLLGSGCVITFAMGFKGLGYRDVFHASSQSPAKTVAWLVPPVLLLVPGLVLVLSSLVRALEHAVPVSMAEQQMFERMQVDDLATTLAVCVVAPILEEMLFRGIILRSFLHQYRRGASVWGSAALFGLAHLNIYQFGVALFLGALAGWLYERSRSLVPCIALHASYNTALTVLARAHAGTDPPPLQAAPAAAWTGSLVLAATGGLLLVFALRRRPGER